MDLMDQIKRDAMERDRISPAARLVADVLDAINAASRLGVSLGKIEGILSDAADDVRDRRAN